MEIQWRLVRALYNMSKEPKYDSIHRKKFVNQAYEIVTKLLTCHSDYNVVHKWYALVLDAKSSQEGMKERIQQLENVKKHMDVSGILIILVPVIYRLVLVALQHVVHGKICYLIG